MWLLTAFGFVDTRRLCISFPFLGPGVRDIHDIDAYVHSFDEDQTLTFHFHFQSKSAHLDMATQINPVNKTAA